MHQKIPRKKSPVFSFFPLYPQQALLVLKKKKKQNTDALDEKKIPLSFFKISIQNKS